MTTPKRSYAILFGVVILAALLALLRGRDGAVVSAKVASESAASPLAAPLPRGGEQFVGSAACADCHRAQSEAYAGSHHAKALLKPSADHHFDGATLATKLGGVTKFSLRDGAPVVSTPLPGGKSATLPIRYVSGVWPLEQYVVETERGKLQSLGVVWDSRTAADGGAKWFHVYGAGGIAPKDSLFFTAPAQSWNHICADCHSTWVERRYDSAADSFDTRWAELSVGCEACHGPGAEHVRTARLGRPAPFAARLTAASEPWLPSPSGSPTPRTQDGAEVEVCAPCHSRRTPLKEGFVASDPFLDSFEPDLLRPERYHADGQVDGEVYEWGSFLQSRMYQAGVKCSNCHEPHSGKTMAEGNALCVRCHEPKRFDVPEHSHHAGGRAPRCIDCHMPPKNFMQIDERRDHSIRIPRPDLSVELGTPNACNGCHTKQPATWARAALAQWYPTSPRRAHFAEALAKDRRGALDAPAALRRLVDEGKAPAIARATALERLGGYPDEKTRQTLRAALSNSDPLVVFGAVRGAASLPPRERAQLLLPILEHRLRAVRVASGKALAGVPLAELSASSRGALERAFAEVEQAFELSASRPEIQVERSAFELARGKLPEARAALQIALRLQPCLTEAQLNLAELSRQRGDEAAAERALRAALTCNPQSAAAHHALGLWQVRAHQPQAAIVSLRRAVELAPDDSRFGYVLAVALAGGGERDGAIQVLEAVLLRRPNDSNALQALAGYLRDAGLLARASETRQKLDDLLRQ